MKKLFLLVALLLLSAPAFSDELKINVDVQNGDKVTEVVGADIYAKIDDKLVEITVSPDKLPFKMNLKAGALRIKSFWMTDKQAK